MEDVEGGCVEGDGEPTPEVMVYGVDCYVHDASCQGPGGWGGSRKERGALAAETDGG